MPLVLVVPNKHLALSGSCRWPAPWAPAAGSAVPWRSAPWRSTRGVGPARPRGRWSRRSSWRGGQVGFTCYGWWGLVPKSFGCKVPELPGTTWKIHQKRVDDVIILFGVWSIPCTPKLWKLQLYNDQKFWLSIRNESFASIWSGDRINHWCPSQLQSSSGWEFPIGGNCQTLFHHSCCCIIFLF